jgi:hypothetical protein
VIASANSSAASPLAPVRTVLDRQPDRLIDCIASSPPAAARAWLAADGQRPRQYPDSARSGKELVVYAAKCRHLGAAMRLIARSGPVY